MYDGCSIKSNLRSSEIIDNISIHSTFEFSKNKLCLTFRINGELKEYIFPKQSKLKKANELWKATCFELFLADEEERYYELNFSSSLVWNLYVLDAYRAEPKEFELEEEPNITIVQKDNEFHIVFELETKAINFEKFKYYNMATILLNKEKERTFWTINHLNDTPNFHNKESFFNIR